MLSLHKHFRTNFSKLFTPKRELELSPIVADDDELTQAIEHQYDDEAYHWDLTPAPDMERLEQFLSEAGADPERVSFED